MKTFWSRKKKERATHGSEAENPEEKPASEVSSIPSTSTRLAPKDKKQKLSKKEIAEKEARERQEEIQRLTTEAGTLQSELTSVKNELSELKMEVAQLRKEASSPFNSPAASMPLRKRRTSLMTQLLGMSGKENPNNDIIVCGLIYIDTKGVGLDLNRVKNTLLNRLLVMPRFRSRLVYKGYTNKAYFDPIALQDMDFSYHIQVALNHGNPNNEDVSNYVSEMLGSGLDFDKPLWKMSIIPQLDDGRALVISFISHTIADGVSQVEVLRRVLDYVEGQNSKPPKKRRKFPPLKKRFGAFVGGVADGILLPFSRPDPKTSLRLKNPLNPSAGMRFATSSKLDLNMCKDIKNKIYGATLNEVFVMILSIAVRRYFEARQEKLPKINAMIPFSLRGRNGSPFKNGDPHNDFALLRFPIFLQYDDVIDLYSKIKARSDYLKLSPAPYVSLASLRALVALVPSQRIINRMAKRVASTATFTLSNVAGPQEKVTLAGYEVDDLAFQLIAPLGIYIGILTYAGEVSMSVNMRSELGDPSEILKHWDGSFQEVYDTIMAFDDLIDPEIHKSRKASKKAVSDTKSTL